MGNLNAAVRLKYVRNLAEFENPFRFAQVYILMSLPARDGSVTGTCRRTTVTTWSRS